MIRRFRLAITAVGMGTCFAACGDDNGTALAPPGRLAEPASEGVALVSQFQVHLPGLQETITHIFYEDPTGFIHKRTLRADGSSVGLAAILEEERVALEARFGRMTVGLAERVERSEPSDLVDLGVVFDPGIDEAAFIELSRRLADEETDRVEAMRDGVVDAGVESGLVVLEESDRAARVMERFNRREAWESERERLIADAVRAS